MSMRLDRRAFLAMSAMGGLGLAAGCATQKVKVRPVPANGKLQHACIGVGGMMGGNDLDCLRSHPRLEVVAICDVDRNHLEDAAKRVPNARKYTDWREMLAAEGDRIDSVNVTVPDHMHAPIALAAIRAGKHAYVQKPLAHDVAECRAMAQAAKRASVVTQLGTQHASGAGDRMGVQFLRAGVVGKVRRVVLCSNRPGAEQYRLPGPRPAQGTTPPEHLAWDLWLGSAPERPFAPDIYHPVKWRAWQDFGTGWSGDIGCHIFDAVWKGLGLTAPKSVIAEVQESWKGSKERRGDTWPQSDHITWIFSGNERTEGPELRVEWFDGEIFPPAEIKALGREAGLEEYPAESAMVVGTEGAMLIPHTSGPLLAPRDKFKGIERPILKGPSHYHRFVDACVEGEMTESHFGQSGPMAEAILLGTVAIRVPGVRLEWDPKRMRLTGHPDAQRLLRRTYRRGWETDLKI